MTHAAAVLACAAVTVTAIALGRRAGPHTAAETLGRRTVAALGISLWVVYVIYFLLPPHFDPATSLPFQLCDLAAAAAVLALLTARRAFITLVVFWGLALSSWGFITPILTQGPASARFWLFWLLHLLIVGAAFYFLVVHRYRPRARDLALAIGVSLTYGLLAFSANALFGSNYGFLGPTTPRNPTPLDYLGAWPLRALWITLLAIGAMTAVWAVLRTVPAATNDPDAPPQRRGPSP